MYAESYQASAFNRLLPIEIAHRELSATNKLEQALRVFGPLFLRHKVADEWGLGLLHKHWNLDADELPIQITGDAPDGRRELITQPRRDFVGEYQPSVFAVVCNPLGLLPLEFSSDAVVQQATLVLRNAQQFVYEFCEAMSTNSLEDTFALVSVRQTDASDAGLVEFNYSHRVSIVREVPADLIAGMRLIQTSWRFSAGPDGECEKSCFARCMANEDGDHEEEHVPLHKPPEPPKA